LLCGVGLGAGALVRPLKEAYAAPASEEDVSRELEGLFAEAGRLRQEGKVQEALGVWDEAIRVAPLNPAARSNRGGLLLQVGRWDEAEAELAESVRLEREALDSEGKADGRGVWLSVGLNQWGNALGAVGRWDEAIAAYEEANAVASRERSPEGRRLAAMPLGNKALALLQIGEAEESASLARRVVARDPGFADMRALLVAALWSLEGGVGAEEAEQEWQRFCQKESQPGASGMTSRPGDMGYGLELTGQAFQQIAGFLGQQGGPPRLREDRTVCGAYEDPEFVAGRWPPRATAALDAFRKLSRTGSAVGYDGERRTYDF